MQESSVPIISTRPYLMRAIHEWIIDNGWTPYLLVDAEADGVRIPQGYTKDGQIVFNTSYSATKNLTLGNEGVTFGGRFNGVSTFVSIPIHAVLAVYAKETGAGMAFHEEPPEKGGEKEGEALPKKEGSGKEKPEKAKEESSPEPPTPGKPSRPVLRIVK